MAIVHVHVIIYEERKKNNNKLINIKFQTKLDLLDYYYYYI